MKSTIPKANENTITSLLCEELKKRGIDASPFMSLDTPVGRREVDIYCKNGGSYVIEAKFMEDDLWRAVGKIQNDYLRYHKFLDLNGGFAILYPEQLSAPLSSEEIKELANKLKFKIVMIFLPEDTRKNFHVVEGNLFEIADKLSNQILTPPTFIEPSIDYIIKLLRDVAHAITHGLRHLTGNELEDLFGGKHVFEDILQYEQGKYPEEDLRLASAYLLVNQILFYHVLSRKRPNYFTEIDPEKVSSPRELNTYFEKVLDINYKAVFSYDVSSRIKADFLHEIRAMIGAIQGITAEKVGGDFLGTIFHDLIPYDVRKTVAAFYTNITAAQLLSWLIINNDKEKVADFACGSGGLLVAAYKKKKWLLEKTKKFTEKDHVRFVEKDLLGVDIMPFAANTAACHLSLQSPEFFTDRVKVAIWDSTELEPNKKIPSIAHIKFTLKGQSVLDSYFDTENKKTKGTIRLGAEKPEEIFLEPQDVVIMNPPFTRQERMPKEYKNHLTDRFDSFQDYLHGQMSLYGYFILLADKFVKDGGHIGFVLPANFLRIKSLEGIRRLLLEKYDIKYVITARGRLNFSEATWKREILLIAKKLKARETQGKTNFVSLSSLPKNVEDIIKISNAIRKNDSKYLTKNNCLISIISPEKLSENLNWFRHISSFTGVDISELWDEINTYDSFLIRFGELFDFNEFVTRGTELTVKSKNFGSLLIPSNQKRAIRKKDRWIVRKIEEQTLTLEDRYNRDMTVEVPRTHILPTLRTTSGNNLMDVQNLTDYVLVKDFSNSDKFFINDTKKLKSMLPIWEKYVKKKMGNLFILRRFPINSPGTIHLAHYSLMPISSVKTFWIANIPHEDDAKILCLWLNSTFHLIQTLQDRVEDVWLEISKYILEDMFVLNPNQLSTEKKKSLVKKFNKLSKLPFPNLEIQYEEEFEGRIELDFAILDALGFEQREAKSFLEKVYAEMRRQFHALKKMS